MVGSMIEFSSFPTIGFIFGGIPEGIVGFVLWLFVSIMATRKAVRFTDGAATPVWLALIWLVPCFGGILALIGIRRTNISTELERDIDR